MLAKGGGEHLPLKRGVLEEPGPGVVAEAARPSKATPHLGPGPRWP